MRVLIAAAGRLRAGPEAALTTDYLARAEAAGRGLGFPAFTLKEIEAKRGGGAEEEGALLLAAAPEGAIACLLDEKGAALGSAAFADRLARWRDEGRPAAVFWIGGADGAAPALKARADLTLAFGPQTWPHRLVRAMLAEQLYRAMTILAGGPYHRA